MSAMTMSPLLSPSIPSLVSMNVTVATGLTARSVPSPEGTSTETTGLPQARVASMKSA